MLSEKMQAAMNKQINAEIYSSYLYLSMAAYFESINLGGFASWMRVQAQEELGHAMKFFDFVNECSSRVTLAAIDAPPSDWDSPLAVFQNVFGHEQKVTGMINALCDQAGDENDQASQTFLQWFVTEQVEEEASADAIVQKLKLAGDVPGELLTLDRELASRPAGG